MDLTILVWPRSDLFSRLDDPAKTTQTFHDTIELFPLSDFTKNWFNSSTYNYSVIHDLFSLGSYSEFSLLWLSCLIGKISHFWAIRVYLEEF